MSVHVFMVDSSSFLPSASEASSTLTSNENESTTSFGDQCQVRKMRSDIWKYSKEQVSKENVFFRKK